MSDRKYSRREVLELSGKVTLSVGAGFLTGTLIPGCSSSGGGRADAMPSSDGARVDATPSSDGGRADATPSSDGASGDAATSSLGIAASSLSPGESLKFGTIPTDVFIAGSDGYNFIEWGSSGVWDPVAREARWVGKRHSTPIYYYHMLVYRESDDTWYLDPYTLHPDLTVAQNGHGYDHNTVDPDTGDHYFRRYASLDFYKLRMSDLTWSIISMPNEFADCCAGLSWVPNLGLVYSDSSNFRYYDGSSWTDINGGVAGGISSYSSVSEYNSIADLLVFGAGNGGNQMWSYDRNLDAVKAIATPSYNFGSSALQGVFAADPASEKFVGWLKQSTHWGVYTPSIDSWTYPMQSTGDGSTPQDGPPNLAADSPGGDCINIPISTHGVIMYVQSRGNTGDVWLFKL